MLTTVAEAAKAQYRRELGDGLILRWSTAEDTEKIVEQVGIVFREKAEDPPNQHLQHVVRRMMRENYPLMGPGDYALVEDTQRKEGNPIVAGVSLWRQQCDYEGVKFGLGRPEIVFTDAAYRRRGLIRALFEIVHARSEAEGHLVQAITGIPYFYRQFGYEYAWDLGGMRGTILSLVPKAKEGEEESYHLREASREDISLVQRLYSQKRMRSKSIVWTHIADEYWRYEMEAWRETTIEERFSNIQMIVDKEGRDVGYVYLAAKRRGEGLGVWDLEIMQGQNLQEVLPPLLRALQVYGLQMPTRDEKTEPLNEINFHLGRQHPVYTILGKHVLPKEEQPPYAWYVRVADLPGFLRHIHEVLEKRLAESELAGYSGEIKLDFYRSGLRMVFEQGKLSQVEDWVVPLYDGGAKGGFPPLLFLQVVFGYHSLDELNLMYPDMWVRHEGKLLLSILFPARPSFVQPL